jgi:hypothetical protein
MSAGEGEAGAWLDQSERTNLTRRDARRYLTPPISVEVPMPL